MTVSESEVELGTRVTFEVNPLHARELRQVFDDYTTDLVFDKTRTVVRLFDVGSSFMSRSEAKRLLSNLEKFREVILDFAKVEAVGQGFADEIFRVWAKAHPQTTLVPQNMEPNVKWMVERAKA